VKPHVNRAQGRLIRIIALYLCNLCKCSPKVAADSVMVVETIESAPWSSLTFSGERHRLSLRLPGMGHDAFDIDFATLAVPGRIIAIREAAWAVVGGDAMVKLDLLELAEGA